MTDSEAVRRMLERLATDDEYRRAFSADPVAELSAHGIKVDPTRIPESGVRLPSKEHIRDNLDELTRQMHDTLGIILFAR